MGTNFSEAMLRKLKPPESGQRDYFEKLQRGRTLMLRVSYGGTKAWRVVYYDHGKPKCVATLGHYPQLKCAEARTAARAFDPKAAKAATEAGSFKEVAELWLQHHVDKQRPAIEARDRPATRNVRLPPVGADALLRDPAQDRQCIVGQGRAAWAVDGGLGSCSSTIRSIMNWWATRDDDYTSPIVKGMKRDQRAASERARTPVLTDNEIRAAWKAAETCGPFGAIIRLLLLTGQRREKVASMQWSAINKDGVWTIPSEKREKGNAGALRLPPIAIDIIAAQSEISGNPYIFPSARTASHFGGWSQRKAELDAKLPGIPGWTLHDLRRTARSLMSRAGVPRDHAERVLGHVIGGVEGVYDRHAYFDEKAAALDKLAKLVDQIVNPPDKDNVVQFTKAG